MRYKVSGAIAIPKASWGCAPALPNRIRVVFLEELLLEETVFSVRQKGVPPLLLPASMLQLPRCLVRICNLFHKEISIMNWKVLKNAIAAGKPCYKDNLLRKCGLLAHTSAAFLKNCCTEKLFICLRLVACSHAILMQCFMWNILRMHIQQVLKKRWKLAWF